REITCESTPKTPIFARVAYVHTPPATTSEAPAGSIKAPVSRPPVTDSAHASVMDLFRIWSMMRLGPPGASADNGVEVSTISRCPFEETEYEKSSRLL